MDPIALVACATGLLAGLGALESQAHRANLRRVPVRIHVNGTRGKSSVTRLIAAGLRAGGLRTLGKTTGTLPRLILPDGSETPVVRRGRANIREQLGVIQAASANGVDALVLECMAVQPLLQSICERRIVRSTHGVITNARADHLDVMGPTPRDVAAALAGTVPVGGSLFTAERVYRDVFAQAAEDRGSRFVDVGAAEAETVRGALAGFSYLEHADNVALALRVCDDLGVGRRQALEGMWRASPDPGAMTVQRVRLSDVALVFVNALAANDPESTEQAWRQAGSLSPPGARRISLVNCRHDREERSVQMARLCAGQINPDWTIAVGTGTGVFAKSALAAGIDKQRIVVGERWPARRVLDLIQSLPPVGANLVVGMGNVAGVGLELIELLRQLERRQAAEGALTLLREAA